MDETILNLNKFRRSSDFYGSIDLMLTIKSFDLQAIRKRYIQSRENKGGKTGSVERRKPSLGGVASITISEGEIIDHDILCRLTEPRGIDFGHKYLAIATENIVHIIAPEGKSYSLTDPWFSYIHTVQFHPNDDERLLISSSGFDLIREYNFKTNLMSFEWLAWENGFNEAIDPETGSPVILTRDPAFAEELEKENTSYHLIEDPQKNHLPTAKRAAFINSATYHPDNPDRILATFFHEGKVYQIDKKDHSATALLSGLKNPHGGHIHKNKLIATSTGSGEIFIKENTQLKKVSFRELAGKPEPLSEMEWIQNTLSYENLFIAIDSNRTSFIITDLSNKVYDIIPYNNDWAVQDLISGEPTDRQKRQLQELK